MELVFQSIPYTGGIAGACTKVGLASGSTVTVRLNLNAYGQQTIDQVCP